MKHSYSKILLLAFTVFGLKANAQCTSCTTTITGMDAANHIVAPGTTLCISPTGIATGQITVSPGATLCNQGLISSSDLWVAGGTFNNYGMVNTAHVLTSNAGILNNYATMDVDSLMIAEANSHLYNYDSINNERFSVISGAFANNNGIMEINYMGDSLGTVVNAGTMNVYIDFGNGYGSTFTNNHYLYVGRDLGNGGGSTFTSTDALVVARDFGNATGSVFTTTGYMSVQRDFYNSTSAVFSTSCMMSVTRDWYNSATINGPATGCGGFQIGGLSLNSGTIAGPHLDFCDAGSPAFGIDGNTGTIAAGTTYCVCNNACTIAVTGIQAIAQSDVTIGNVYPNPAVNVLTVMINTKEAGTLQVEVFDMTGKKQITTAIKAAAGENKTSVDVSSLAQGAYILSITDQHQLQTKQLFNIVK